MNNRLYVGCLAWILDSKVKENIGKVVRLVRYEGQHYDSWEVHAHEPLLTTGGMRSVKGFVESKNLMPLGDDKGIELYGLREEIMTKRDKEAV